MALQSHDTWCPQPWIGISVRSSGDMRYCCHANSSMEKGLLTDDRGNVMNVSSNQIGDAVNSRVLKEVRLAMLKGQRYSGCMRCYNEEDAGLFSRRQSDQKDYPEITINGLNALTKPDGTIDKKKFPIKFLDLRLGNKCNLKCRMCGATESDQWYEVLAYTSATPSFTDLEKKFKIVKCEKGKYKIINDPYQWHLNESFWKQLEPYIPSLERVYLVGGEPLLIENHFKFLNLCIEMGFSKNIILEYNTNLTAVTSDIIKTWTKFKKVELGLSIDGIGIINDYIRPPSKWSQIEKKLDFIDATTTNIQIRFTPTIQIYNVLHLPDLMLWTLNKCFKKINKHNPTNMILSPHPLHNPGYLSIQAFPHKSKLEILNRFQKAKDNAENKFNLLRIETKEEMAILIERYKKIIDDYSSFMMQNDLSYLRNKFWHNTNLLDKLHGLSLKDVSPLTHELMQ